MQTPTIEIAIFTVKPGQEPHIPEIRQGIINALKTFPGFLDYTGCQPAEGNRHYVDIVKWDSLENAHNAAKTFEAGDPRFVPYMEVMEEHTFMGHVTTQVTGD